MSFTDATTRIAQIQSQIASLTGAFSPQPVASTSTSSDYDTSVSSSSALGSSGSFAAQLAAAQGSSTTLPSGASSQLTTDQQAFASRLASDTGLDPGVVSAWLLAEESGSAAQARQSAGNNDWLNVGYTDSGTYGAADSVWSDPITAADATAGWLKGQATIPGYGTASAGIQAILGTAGQSPEAQIVALQSSGWASSGYPDLSSLYSQILG